MNIFVLDADPVKAAQMQCDKHVVKMILETAQMLSTSHRVVDESDDEGLYKTTHKNHPCSIWTRLTDSNYNWLFKHFIALCDEYTYRYGKVHLTDIKMREKLKCPPKNIPKGDLTSFAKAMPDDIISDNVVEAYRKYYLEYKADIARWEKTRKAPDWWGCD